MSYRDHECDILKVAAQDLQLGSRRGQGRLLYALHQHVEYPGFEINNIHFVLIILLFLVTINSVKLSMDL